MSRTYVDWGSRTVKPIEDQIEARDEAIARVESTSAVADRDLLADACRASWEAHATAIRGGNDLEIVRAYLGTLRAELALETDCYLLASTDGARRAYAADIEALKADIEDAEKLFAKTLETNPTTKEI